jgi:anti-anti-sigma factor
MGFSLVTLRANRHDAPMAETAAGQSWERTGGNVPGPAGAQTRMASNLFQYRQDEGIHVLELRLPAMIDMTDFDRLTDELLKLLDGRGGAAWVLDLSDVQYMGSAMLGLMVNVRQRIKSGAGTVVLCSLPPRLGDIFRASAMERLFQIARTFPDALQLAGEQRGR